MVVIIGWLAATSPPQKLPARQSTGAARPGTSDDWTECRMRIGCGRTFPSRRALAALGLAAALAAACGSSNPTAAPTSSPGAGATDRPSGPVIVGAPGESPSSTEAPAPAIHVDFEVNGDENNGWWWLRDDA